jgi:hypothetical protein
MWKNIIEPDMQQMTIWRIYIELCVLKAINKHSEYVILLAFLLRQWGALLTREEWSRGPGALLLL